MISILRSTSSTPMYIAIDYEALAWSPPERDIRKLELRYNNHIPNHSFWQLLGPVNSLPFTFEDYPELLL